MIHRACVGYPWNDDSFDGEEPAWVCTVCAACPENLPAENAHVADLQGEVALESSAIDENDNAHGTYNANTSE